MNEKKRLTAGQFAQMLHIDRHLLDKYDEIGLFQPNFRENNGHKWYTLDQVNDWQLVNGSLQLGMRPNELQNRFERPLSDLLREQQTRIDAAISRLTALRHHVSTALGHLEAVEKSQLDVVTELKIPTMGLIETPVSQMLDDAIVRHLNRLRQPDLGPLLVGQRFSRLEMVAQPVAVFTVIGQTGQQDADIRLSSGRYLCGYHRGTSSFEPAFERLNDYATDHNWQLGDDYFVFPIQTQLTESPTHTEFNKILIDVRS